MARVPALAALGALLLVAGAAAAPRPGGTVAIGSPSDPPACLRPYSVVCEQGVHPEPIVQKVLAGAFEPRPDFTYEPDLAQASYTRDPFVVTYRIRPEARWSDGVPVTAHDFVFTFLTVIRSSDTGPASTWRRIRRVVPVDDKTVRVVFHAPTGDWRSLFDPVLPRHALIGEDFQQVWRDRIDNPKTRRPLGSGPFLVQGWDRAKQQLTMIKNPAYWGPHKAYLDRLVVRWVPRDPLAALRRGEADIMTLSGRPEIVTELRLDPRFRIFDEGGLAQWEQLTIRVGPGGHPALERKLVRQALAYGIDRVAIVRDLYGTIAPRLRPLDNAILFANDAHYRANWSRYRYRPAEAERLLDRAGCRRGDDGVRVCAGARLSLRLVTSAGIDRRRRTFELAQAQLGRIGIELAPEYASQRALVGPEGIIQRGVFDLALFAYSSGTADPLVGKFLCGNLSGYCNRLVQRDLQQIPLVLDAVRRGEVANAADRKLAEDVPLIPLYQPPNLHAVRTTVMGFVPSPFGGRVTYRAEDWWLDRGR